MAGVPLRAVWQIGLWAVVLPGVLLLVLVRGLADRVEPGTGVAVAVVLGLGTLVLPFSTLLFAHVPAALLAFASFAVLFRRRSAVLAGACAGLAVATDLPLLVIAGRAARVRVAPRLEVRARSARRRGAALRLRHLGVRKPVPPRRRAPRSTRARAASSRRTCTVSSSP